jgi:hypothetical protein
MTTTRTRALAQIAARFGKLSRLAVLSTAATATVVAVGVAAAPSPDSVQASTDLSGSLSAARGSVDLGQLVDREQSISRTAPRVALQPKAADHKFATAPLNIWTAPREQGKRLGLLKWGTKVSVTGQVVGHWAEVLLPNGKDQAVRWVNADYLANQKPKPEKVTTTGSSSSTSTGGTSAPSVGGTCTNGSSVASGVSPSIFTIHDAVCANWPEITTYGTFRADSGDHGSGHAVDIMISGATGYDVAEFVRAHASEFGVSYIIYSQHIWSVDRAGEGWRAMEDRGSITANHYDHVHVSVY